MPTLPAFLHYEAWFKMAIKCPPVLGIFFGLSLWSIALSPPSVNAAELETVLETGPKAERMEVDQSFSEEIPEEVLRSEILLDGRSPLTGELLTATEYAELQTEIEKLNAVTPQVAPKLRNLVGLIKLRKFIKTVLPIVPIK